MDSRGARIGEQQRPAEAVGAKPAPGRATRVLIVEDEQDIAGLIKHTLERSGDMQASVVTSGEAAL